MRLSPADVRTVYHYRDHKVVGVELHHRPSGCRSGIHRSHELADHHLREGVAAWAALRQAQEEARESPPCRDERHG